MTSLSKNWYFSFLILISGMGALLLQAKTTCQPPARIDFRIGFRIDE